MEIKVANKYVLLTFGMKVRIKDNVNKFFNGAVGRVIDVTYKDTKFSRVSTYDVELAGALNKVISVDPKHLEVLGG